MTERYWKNYRDQLFGDPYYSDPMWRRIRQDVERKQAPKHHLELYSYCRSDNPYIRQIKASPNITTEMAAELICREKACELQYCLSLQRVTSGNKRANLDLKGCSTQYNNMNSCLIDEKARIIQKEEELREMVIFGSANPPISIEISEVKEKVKIEKNEEVYI